MTNAQINEHSADLFAGVSALERKAAERFAAYVTDTSILLRDSNPHVDYVTADRFDEATGLYECTMHIETEDDGKWTDAMIKALVMSSLSANTAEMQAMIMLSVAPGGDEAINGAMAGMEARARPHIIGADALRDRSYTVQPVGNDGRFVVRKIEGKLQ